MDAIFKNGNVYVVVRDKDIRDDVNLKNLKDLICDNKYRNENYLYGGRVHVKIFDDCDCKIEVDGITILWYYLGKNSIESNYWISIEKIAAYLNQIENLGVDSFLENYKLQLQELKKEIESKIEDMQQDLATNYNEERASNLANLRHSVLNITCTIFLFLINMNAGLENMNAGLENQNYIDAYNNIINLYF